MTEEEQFTEELTTLILRYTPSLRADVLYQLLLDEAVAQQGVMMKEQFDAGHWPPEFDKK